MLSIIGTTKTKARPVVVILGALAIALFWPAGVWAGELTVAPVAITDFKPVYATVESTDIANARARTGGTVIELKIDEGDVVAQGQILAVVGDDKLALQMDSLNAQIASAQAQQAKTQDDYNRAQELFRNGTVAKARLDEARAAFQVADNQLKSVTAQRAVIDQQVKEGQILAPAAGRVLDVPITKGAVLMPGEVAARIAANAYVLRLQLPERHASELRVGDTVRLEDGRTGTLRQIYPQIANGRVQADADVPELAGYFVGQRIRVEVSTGTHSGYVVPPSYLVTRAGIDYIQLKQEQGQLLVPVQRGETLKDGIEIVSGLQAGDVLLSAGD